MPPSEGSPGAVGRRVAETELEPLGTDATRLARDPHPATYTTAEAGARIQPVDALGRTPWVRSRPPRPPCEQLLSVRLFPICRMGVLGT